MREGKGHWIRDRWNELSPVAQDFTFALMGIGSVCIWVGWRADRTGAWKDYPFTVNVISAIATACFGIPVALLILRYLLTVQEERSARLRAIREAQESSERLANFASYLIGNLDYFDEDVSFLEDERDRIRRLLKYFPTELQDWSHLPVARMTYQRELAAALNSGEVGHLEDRRRELVQYAADAVEDEWRYFQRHVQPLLQASSLPRLPVHLVRGLDDSVSRARVALWAQSHRDLDDGIPLKAHRNLYTTPDRTLLGEGGNHRIGFRPDADVLLAMGAPDTATDAASHVAHLREILEQFDEWIHRMYVTRNIVTSCRAVAAWCDEHLQP
ncbi:hypothetical protein [Arthrobacter zhaoguopingii]|uniref:hypothetical protein n=1 Tax=Arthrobacter zhaoguopingii TaxID=2681491 RepID=UPI00135CDA59|nr:hypothetical protein [Arthrobacter zhaoguopingii]